MLYLKEESLPEEKEEEEWLLGLKHPIWSLALTVVSPKNPIKHALRVVIIREKKLLKLKLKRARNPPRANKKRKVKTPYDPRHIKRQKAIKNLFRWSFQSKQKIKNELAKAVLSHRRKIDQIVAESAPDWPIEQINRVDLAILRLAIYELAIVKKEPPKVIIDEAVELAKRYGSEKSSSFINGVLGTVLKKIEKKEKHD